jgi:tetratricopeptide (TPR) repeat protein
MHPWNIWLSIFLIIGLAMAEDVPFVFDKNSSDISGYTSDQLEKISRSSPDLVGVPSLSKPSEDKIIENTAVMNKSINQSPKHNNTTVSNTVLLNFIEFNVYNETATSIEEFNTDLPPFYSQMITTPTYQDWFKEGNTNYDCGDYEKAIACYDQAIQLNPQLPGVWCNKGMALCRLKKYQEAIKAFDKSLELDPHYEKALKSKAEALQAIDREAQQNAATQRQNN